MKFCDKFCDLKLIKIPFFISIISIIYIENNHYNIKDYNIRETNRVELLEKSDKIENVVNIEKNITIEVDVSGSKDNLGPSVLTRGIKEVLPYQTGKCTFIPSNTIYPIYAKNKTDYFYFPNPRLTESVYNEWIHINETHRLIMGPMYAPTKYFLFPNPNIWSEKRYNEVLNSIKGFCVHSERVRDHLAKRSGTTDIINKYIISRACTNLKPEKIKPFYERNVDIIFYEKYLDLNRKKQGNELFKLLSKTNKSIEKIEYFHYTKDRLDYLANNAKFIIYFSFYDTGAIGLKEIQNHGVFTFTLQKELVINDASNFYIPELDTENEIEKGFHKIMKIIDEIMISKPDTELVAKTNQEYNKCQKALDDICSSL